MSILIKALKQAEREHMARSAAAAPAGTATAVLESEPAPPPPPAPTGPATRPAEALSLAPVEASEPAAAGNTPAPDALARHDPTAGPRDEASPDKEPDLPRDPGRLVDYETAAAPEAAAMAEPAPAPARASSSFARPLAAVLQTTDQGIAPPAATPPAPAARPGADAARRATPAQRPADNNAGTGVDRATPAPAATAVPPAPVAEDPQVEQRKAARQLVAAAPGRAPLRRIAIVLGVLIVLAGAAGAAYWQGLFAGLEGLASTAQAPAPAPGRTLADRMASLPGGAPGKTAKPAPHTGAAGSASTIKAHEAGAVSALPATDTHAAALRATAGPPPASAAPASDGIHLRLPEASPDRLRAILQDAYAAAGRGDNATATRLYQQVIDLDHNNGDAWIGLGALAANSGDSAGASRAYRRALEIDPSDSIALGGLLGLQSNLDPQEAESRLRLLIVHDGAQPVLLAALGRLLARQGRWLEAQETFFKAWSADPSQPDVAFNLAVTLERIRQPQPALSFYRRALELARDHSARFNLAVAQERVAALTPKQP